MRATFKLLNSYFWKTIYGPILTLFMPLVLLVILGNIFRIEYVYPGIIAMSFLFTALLSLPLAIMELKRSALFKYIGTSPVNPMRFTVVVIAYFVFISLCSTMIIFIGTMIFFSDKVFINRKIKEGILGGIFSTFSGFFSFIVACGVHLLFVIVSGILISTFAKTPQQALTIGIVVIIPSIFLSGMIISVDVIAESNVFNFIAHFVPYRYSTGNIVISSTPVNQVGDILQRMTPAQKGLIFNVVNFQTGEITIRGVGLNEKEIYKVNTMNELIDVKNILKDNFMKNIHDEALFELVIARAIDSGSLASDNNIFNWVDPWAVQRIPSVESVRAFVTKYFNQYTNGNWERLEPIANQIMGGKYDWLDIFLKQTNTLYPSWDRVLNLMLPLTLISVFGIYINYKFTWSVR